MSSERDLEQRRDIQVRFDSRVHRIEAIKKACYRLSKRFVASIELDGDCWVCSLAFPIALSHEAIEAATRDLQIEVLDQGLRETIAAETAPVRNAILAVAFSRTGLQGSE